MFGPSFPVGLVWFYPSQWGPPGLVSWLCSPWAISAARSPAFLLLPKAALRCVPSCSQVPRAGIPTGFYRPGLVTSCDLRPRVPCWSGLVLHIPVGSVGLNLTGCAVPGQFPPRSCPRSYCFPRRLFVNCGLTLFYVNCSIGSGYYTRWVL